MGFRKVGKVVSEYEMGRCGNDVRIFWFLELGLGACIEQGGIAYLVWSLGCRRTGKGLLIRLPFQMLRQCLAWASSISGFSLQLANGEGTIDCLNPFLGTPIWVISPDAHLGHPWPYIKPGMVMQVVLCCDLVFLVLSFSFPPYEQAMYQVCTILYCTIPPYRPAIIICSRVLSIYLQIETFPKLKFQIPWCVALLNRQLLRLCYI